MYRRLFSGAPWLSSSKLECLSCGRFVIPANPSNPSFQRKLESSFPRESSATFYTVRLKSGIPAFAGMTE